MQQSAHLVRRRDQLSGSDFVGGDVNLRVSPVSVDISARPLVTIHLPSGNQEKKAKAQNMEK